MRRQFAIALTFLGLTACVTVDPVVGPVAAAPVAVIEKNYELGRPMKAVVGQALVRVKDYEQTKTVASALEANQLFSVVGPTLQVNIAQGQRLRLVGRRTVDGVDYALADIGDFRALQVGPDGRIRNKVLNAVGTGAMTPVEMVYSFTVQPETARLLPVTDTKTSQRPGATNFEIVFNGTDGSSMRFQYREFSPDDLARPAFFQELSYPLSAKTIRFRDLTIEIMDIGVSEIAYRVIADRPA